MGAKIYELLSQRDDLEFLIIDPDKRRDVEERKKFLNAADLVLLCLPEDTARETIPLVDIRAADDLIYAFDTGDISLVTADLTGTGSLGFAGDHEVWDCPSSTMIYIGYNCARGPCADAALRRALDRAWDRNTVAVALFSRHAQAAVLPVHPVSPLYDQEADQRRANARLRRLPMEQQRMIADKYFSGEMPWRGEVE